MSYNFPLTNLKLYIPRMLAEIDDHFWWNLFCLNVQNYICLNQETVSWDTRLRSGLQAGVQVTGSRTLLLRHQYQSRWWMAFGTGHENQWPASVSVCLSWRPQYDTGKKCRIWVCPWEGGDYGIFSKVCVVTHSYDIMPISCYVRMRVEMLKKVCPLLNPYEPSVNLTHLHSELPEIWIFPYRPHADEMWKGLKFKSCQNESSFKCNFKKYSWTCPGSTCQMQD